MSFLSSSLRTRCLHPPFLDLATLHWPLESKFMVTDSELDHSGQPRNAVPSVYGKNKKWSISDGGAFSKHVHPILAAPIGRSLIVMESNHENPRSVVYSGLVSLGEKDRFLHHY